MHWVALITLLAVLEYVAITLACGRARMVYGVAAPAVTGHPVFERHYRVQQNTLEQLIAFLPALWLFAALVSAPWAAILGAVFVVGRALYARAYVRNPALRGPGFGLGAGATMILLAGALIGCVVALI